MGSISYLNSWIEEVYLPKLHDRKHELLFERQEVWESGDRFSEYFLQIVWNERYMVSQLFTVSGNQLRIIHPGIWNVSAGPDFHNATIVVGETVLHGDIEIHQRTSDWIHHGHDKDSRYRDVILHVVWENDMELSSGPPETLVLSTHLSPEWHILLQDVEDACYPYARQVSAGQCAMRWALSDDATLQSILAAAGLARLAAKGARIQRLCVEHGTDQALYELFFDCLGFRNNRQAFRKLAELVPLEFLSAQQGCHIDEAILLGSSGLLPDMTQSPILPEWRASLEELWRLWWQSGLPKHELPWNLAGSRPFNSPHRRLAAGIEFLRTTSFQPTRFLKKLAVSAQTPKDLLKTMLSLDFSNPSWLSYMDFKTKLPISAKLLGTERMKDIIANIWLPYLSTIEPSSSQEENLAELARQTYILLPPGQNNRLLTEASHRFLTPPS
ncbi:MAG: DUF2851 family protein, partial [Victivallales bacterium]|nr:DUF2851 family protein [Victivallales bacterium]